MSVDVVLALGEEERAAALAVRWAVFVVEQQVDPGIERDEADATAEHLLARIDGVPVGAARLVVRTDGLGVAGRVAVLQAARGRGVGAAIMAAVEGRAAQLGLARVELHAQTPVRGFYEALGYTAHGAVYQEAGIPHVTMDKPLAGR